ncbi:ATP-dependent DNA helicase RecG [Fodinicola feengrottensis]|uniref:Probable DNA 3'-5' helicase RecG n=2 Tax=Fodinicola feengrottensis TaxID=435914 RepID=A0ABN2H669_9ACTN
METPLRTVLGNSTAKKLADRLDMHTVSDLMHHFPRRYAERGEHTDLGSLEVGEEVTVLAQVQAMNERQTFTSRAKGNSRLQIAEVTVGDGRSKLKLTFFNQKQRMRQLQVGTWALFAGKVTRFNNNLQITNAEFNALDPLELLDPDFADNPEAAAKEAVEVFAGELIPVYPATAKVQTWAIARCVQVTLATMEPPLDPLSVALLRRRGLLDLNTALREIHRPSSRGLLQRAKKRLAFDEALALQITLAQRRHEARAHPTAPRPGVRGGLLDAFDARLPFTLTGGQREIGEVVSRELTDSYPMHRLLQGEVGSGKTVCALRAMLQVVDSGGQAALLAPTEVLASQHARSLRKLLGPFAMAGELGAVEHATRITLVTGKSSMTAAARRNAELEVFSGEAGIVVGTHALLTDAVQFADLGLVVVDEQHRFGVEQRDALRAKSKLPPHVLVMTATPIPRTVAITVYGDLEVSALAELPAGRAGITTHVVPAGDQRWMDRTWKRVREEVAAGRQAYIVCPRIGEETGGTGGPEDDLEIPADLDQEQSEKRELLAVLDVAPMLMEGPLAGLRCAILHGRMSADEKEAVMTAFGAGKLDVLIATTVIEVGVDVPNATVMVVLDADRFGVSQLHQLRGRVGRGGAPGLCLLVTGTAPETPTGQRLKSVAENIDGFKLARIDLEQRREGDVLGALQSGRRSQLKLLSLLRDHDLIQEARDEATAIVEADPSLSDHQPLAAAVRAFLDPDSADYLSKG